MSDEKDLKIMRLESEKKRLAERLKIMTWVVGLITFGNGISILLQIINGTF